MTFVGSLKPYQEEPVKRFLERGNLLVAYEMGLGKTVIGIAAAEELIESKKIRCCVIVCPASLKYQWAQRLSQFTDGWTKDVKIKKDTFIEIPLMCEVIDGTKYQRDEQYGKIAGQRPHYIIMGYDNVINDAKDVSQIKPDMVILDEATAIKTFKAKRTKQIKKMFKVPYRLALTGTPIENRPGELFCADEETEIFSKRGWLKYEQVSDNDVVLTLNHKTGQSEWNSVRSVNVFQVENQQMLHMKHRDHSSLTTLNHRWPVERAAYVNGKPNFSNRARAWATSESFQYYDRFAIAAERADNPVNSLHSDDIVELVAWLYTEGHVRKNRDGSLSTAVYITQNTGTEGEQRIAAALTEVFGNQSSKFPRTGQKVDAVPRWRIKYDGDTSVFALNTIAGKCLLQFAPDKVPSIDFLTSLTSHQLELFISTSMLADNNGKQWFSQKNPDSAEAFQYACLLAGHGIAIAQEPKVSYDRKGEPYHMTRVTIRSRKYCYPANSRKEIIKYTGNVWCPVTENGTWLARRRGSVYFTGNSIMQWVDDKILGRYDLFDKAYCKRNHFGWVTGYKNLPVLRKRISPALSRKSRLDPDVRPYLPEVDYSEDWTVEISKPVKDIYKMIAQDILDEMKNIDPRSIDFNSIYSGEENSAQGKIMAMIMCLEMLLDHPDLIIMSAQNGAKYANYLWQEGYLDSIMESQKLDLIKDKIAEILQYPENKLVIFSFYRGMLDILQEELDAKTVQYHGELSATQKSAVIAAFSGDNSIRVLLSSHAGSYGTDLYMVNYLINYDQPWSSGRADQINGRHVRVSSEFRQVFVRDILAEDTIDEWKKRKVIRKRMIAGSVLDGQGSEDDIEIDGDSLKDHLLWVIKNW
jgi:superfamily II DNA or RNA helicase